MASELKRAVFLARASEALASSLDYEHTLRTVARLAVPQFADFCAVDLATAQGDVQRLAVEHVDPNKIDLLRQIDEQHPPEPGRSHGVGHVIRTGKTEFYPEIDPNVFAAAGDQRHLALAQKLDIGSAVIAPLVARDHSLGAITVAYSGKERRYTQDDVTLIEDLARRAAVAIDNAVLVRDLETARKQLERQKTELGTQTEVLKRQARVLREAEQDLLRERARLRTFVEYAPVGIIIVNAQTRKVVLSNPAAQRILRRSAPQDDGDLDWVAMHPSGRPVGPDEHPVWRAINTGQIVGPQDYLHQRADGTTGWIRVTSVPIRSPKGEVTSGLSVIDDVDEQKRAEQQREQLMHALTIERTRLDEILMQAPAHIAVVRGPDHIIELANPLFRQLTSNGGDVMGLPIRDVLPDIDPVFHQRLDEALHTDRQIRGVEIPVTIHPAHGGQPEDALIDFAMQPIIAIDGTAGDIIIHGIDVTEKVRARRAVEEANRAKSDFLATISHELRTPLNAMIGYSDLLLEDIPVPIAPEAKKNVERISLSAGHLLQLIEEILIFTRLEAGSETVERECIDLAPVMKEVRAISEPLTRDKKLDLIIRTPDGPVMLKTDPRKVRQILINLVSNAVKFTNRGSITVELRRADGSAEIEVRDTGIGIERRHLEQIFEPFWQVDSGKARRAGGTGLGLSVSRRLARLLGGDITVTSSPGQGSSFLLKLPGEC